MDLMTIMEVDKLIYCLETELGKNKQIACIHWLFKLREIIYSEINQDPVNIELLNKSKLYNTKGVQNESKRITK